MSLFHSAEAVKPTTRPAPSLSLDRVASPAPRGERSVSSQMSICTEVFDEVYIYYSAILKQIPYMYIYRGNGFSHVTGHYGGVEGVFDCMPVTIFVSCTVTVSQDGKISISEHAFRDVYPPSRSHALSMSRHWSAETQCWRRARVGSSVRTVLQCRFVGPCVL